jgi:ubiquinone/menaquinone biosynthesis C-methylase UbiE
MLDKSKTDRLWNEHIKKLNSLPELTYEWEQDLYIAFRKYLKPGMKIIELGCSNARWVRLFMQAEQGIKGYGLDMDDVGFDSPDIQFIKGDARSTGFADNEFDIAFSIGLVEHFKGEDFEQMIAEHLRIAKTCFITFPLMDLFTLDFLKLSIMQLFGLQQGAKMYRTSPQKVLKVLDKNEGLVELRTHIGWILRWRNIAVPRFSRAKFFADEAIIVATKK